MMAKLYSGHNFNSQLTDSFMRNTMKSASGMMPKLIIHEVYANSLQYFNVYNCM